MKFQVNDTVKVINPLLQSYGRVFVVAKVIGTCVYDKAGNWNDENELELVNNEN